MISSSSSEIKVGNDLASFGNLTFVKEFDSI